MLLIAPANILMCVFLWKRRVRVHNANKKVIKVHRNFAVFVHNPSFASLSEFKMIVGFYFRFQLVDSPKQTRECSVLRNDIITIITIAKTYVTTIM